MKLIKIFFILLVINISPLSWTIAEDIQDFEIEGMSIGDSLLEHDKTIGLTIEDLKSFKLAYYPNSKKFAGLSIKNMGNFKQYESVQFHIDPNNYKIYAISGKIKSPYINKLDKCFEKMEIVFNELKDLFPNAQTIKGEKKSHIADKTGNSYTKNYRLKLKNGMIRIDCHDWSENHKDFNGRKSTDNFMVSIVTKKLVDWINNEAY